ncbi:Spo0B domain-containing protein [Thermoactinomyces sp. DSM 45892]|uniref:Spo0B domain-containing protein n=1 Tax=Thermoactinomyces sp. DSM 45892 TaxID=1882753 RepID=UPI00089C333E|nr:Spo0B domain-containing protein [Thermoactinomyces sp. DSM 45892]SDY05042.1 Sensor_kinase_SpoOB-type, alpha-helical domain [Thermoactinomyces sp. DSM 45892]
MVERMKEIILPFLPLGIVFISWTIVTWESWVDFVYLTLALLSWLLGAFMIRYKLETKRETAQAEKLKKILSRIRHDWANHIQMMIFFLQMKKEEEHYRYLKKLAEDVNKEKHIGVFQSPLLATFLLTIGVEHTNWKWHVDISKDIRISLPEEEDLLQMIKSVADWFDQVGQGKYDWAQIQLTLSEEEQVVYVTFEVYDYDHKRIVLPVTDAWDRLEERVSKLGGKISLSRKKQRMMIQHIW